MTDYDAAASRTCARCGRSLAGRRPQARYCSSTCRSAASHKRRYHANIEAARAKGREKQRRLRLRRAAATRRISLLDRIRAALLPLLTRLAGFVW